MIGTILIYLTFALALGSTFLYFYSYKFRENAKANKLTDIAGIFYWVISFCVIFVAVYLLSLILDHNFQYTYIYEYSSKELQGYLLFSSFYAGQQGSFLLWTLFFVIIGLFVKPYAKKHGYEELVMGFYTLIISFLVLLIIVKSPFEYIWQTYKEHQQIATGFMPEDGRGMNPILQNYWMAIHPPILFLGYASMSVPFVFAMACLIKKDFTNWIKVSIPWTLFATAILGTGIMLGGFWAYETLGWGGFWGWDPVENSSLLPWVVAVSLVHTLLVQEKTGGLIKTNLVLSVLTFLLVIYATFLTRSGVLADTSVHSFSKPGNFVYILLIIFMALFVLMSLITFIVRWKDMPSNKITLNATSKEFFITIGALLTLAIGLIIFFGTSLPIFSSIVGSKQGAPQTKFYNDSNLPIAILILLTNTVALYLNWRATPMKLFFKKIQLWGTISLILTIMTIFLGVNTISWLLLVFGAFFTLTINLDFAIRSMSKNWKLAGAYISHFGIALLIFGILGTGVFSETKSIQLGNNESKSAFGYKFTFIGNEQIEKELKDREKYLYIVKVEKGDNIQYIKPLIYLSDFNERQEPYLEPGIKSYVWKDIYIAPKAVENDLNGPGLQMKKNQTMACPLDTNLKITFVGFEMASEAPTANEPIKLGAIVDIKGKNLETVDTLITLVDMQATTFTPVMKKIEGTGIYGGFAQFIRSQDNLANSQVLLVFSSTENPTQKLYSELFTFDVSTKPLINLVWLGVLAVVIGFVISIFRHRSIKF